MALNNPANLAIAQHSPAARALAAFVRTELQAYRTGKLDPKTNIIDQDAKATYAVPTSMMGALFAKLEAVRRENVAAHFSEKQGSAERLYSGIMDDYDLVCGKRPAPPTMWQYHAIASALATRLIQDLDLSKPALLNAAPTDPPYIPPKETKFHVFFIVKPAPTPLTDVPPSGIAAQQADVKSEPKWKYGMHVLVPGVCAKRSYKKYKLSTQVDDPAIAKIMDEIRGNAGGTGLDLNSASVPVLFLGSCKRGVVTAYELGAAFEVAVEHGRSTPILRHLPPEELKAYNLVSELSLTQDSAPLQPGAPVLVTKLRYEVRESIAAAVRDYGERKVDSAADEDELLMTDSALSVLTANDGEARLLKMLLEALPEEYHTKYVKWRDVVFALANTNANYRLLAEWFSQKCPAKWADSRAESLDALWTRATSARHGSVGAQLTKRSIMHWVRTESPERYQEIAALNYLEILTRYVYEYKGKLEHFMIAKVLHAMLGPLFCVDTENSGRGIAAYTWFEFVTAARPNECKSSTSLPHEVWKWRREEIPDTIMIYMSDQLPKVMNQVAESLKDNIQNAKTEALAKFYKTLAKDFDDSRRKVFDSRFKQNVLREMVPLFRRRGFAESLDKPGKYIGVGNGVGQLGAQCSLIAGFHEVPISKFTTTCWRRFDPRRNPWDSIVLGAAATIIPEPDARDWILFYIASSLDGDPKEGIVLNWEGGGANGKTSWIKGAAGAFGKYARKVAITLFTSEREASDKPNSALMAYKGLRLAYVEELNKAEQCNVARLKEIINPGLVTASEKFGRQEDFAIIANTLVASQYSFGISTTDHGTWRRIKQYKSKIKFKTRPDPRNPFERQDDQRFVREYPNNPDYLEAMLALLVFYYERLQREHRGEVKNILSRTIQRETEAYRNSQDTLNRFITERIVISPESDTTYPISSVGASYAAWYTANIDHKKHVASDVIKELESSIVSKYLKLGHTRTLQLVGCRILTPDTAEVFDGEEYLAAAEMRGGGGADAESETGGPGARSADPDLWWQGRVFMEGDIRTNYIDTDTATGTPKEYTAQGRLTDESLAEDLEVLRAERRVEDNQRRGKAEEAASEFSFLDDPPANDKPVRAPPPWRKLNEAGAIIYPDPKYIEEGGERCDTKEAPRRPPPWRKFDASKKIILSTAESRAAAAAAEAAHRIVANAGKPPQKKVWVARAPQPTPPKASDTLDDLLG